MKNLQKRQLSPISLFYCLKLNKFLYTTSLFAVVLGIFLLPKTAFMASITPDRIISLTNDERLQAGLNALNVNDRLTDAAEAKAQAIIASQTFDHSINGRRFSSWIKATGYQYSLVGENLAMDFVTDEGVMRAWMDSPEHRANLLEPSYIDIGVGVAEGKFQGENTIVIAQIFGDPLIKTAPIPADISLLREHILPGDKNNFAPKNYLSLYDSLLEKLSQLSERQVAMF
jgi:Cysteine-rich secretory protein family